MKNTQAKVPKYLMINVVEYQSVTVTDTYLHV